jgi:hypothetical protein
MYLCIRAARRAQLSSAQPHKTNGKTNRIKCEKPRAGEPTGRRDFNGRIDDAGVGRDPRTQHK